MIKHVALANAVSHPRTRAFALPGPDGPPASRDSTTPESGTNWRAAARPTSGLAAQGGQP
jgi:hypothetical protein